MADAVAIISVAGSTLVGLGGLASAVWGQRAARLWQGRENRAAEMRDVLDDAAKQIADAMQAAADAHRGIDALTPSLHGVAREALLDDAIKHLYAAISAEKQIWVTSNRLRVRTGAQAHVALALKDAEHDVGLLVALVGSERRDQATSADYAGAWAQAEAAERAFYDAAAKDLNAAVERKGR